MRLEILIIGVLFPAIPLMMVNFGNRYTVLANLVRHLHDEVIRDDLSQNDTERLLLKISRLRNRLWLISITQSCAAIGFVLALMAMILTYFDKTIVASMMFLCAITLLIIPMLLFTREIQIANSALDVHLSDLQTRQEWTRHLGSKLSQRIHTKKPTSNEPR